MLKRQKLTEERIPSRAEGRGVRSAGQRDLSAVGVSEATFHVWRNRYGNPALLAARDLHQLRDLNARLKRLLADITLDRNILQAVN
jgi:putative transposase